MLETVNLFIDKFCYNKNSTKKEKIIIKTERLLILIKELICLLFGRVIKKKKNKNIINYKKIKFLLLLILFIY